MTSPITLDARHMTCTALGRCEYWTERSEPVTYDGHPVTNYWAELDRRGDDHVHTCPGIYPIGNNNDTGPVFANPVCEYGTSGGGGRP